MAAGDAVTYVALTVASAPVLALAIIWFLVFPIGFAAVVGAASWRLGFLLVALCPIAGFIALRPLAER